MRIIPYQSAEGVIDGVVITFTETTQIRKTAEALSELKISQAAARYAEDIVDTVREPLVILDEGLRVISANESFYNMFQVSKGETEGQLIYELGNRQWNLAELKSHLTKV